MIWNIVQLEESFPTIRGADSRAFFDEMRSETIDSTLRELLTTGLASMLITIARVVELCTSNEMLQDQCFRQMSAVAFRNWIAGDVIAWTRHIARRDYQRTLSRAKHNAIKVAGANHRRTIKERT
jgi:hypothetical protein